MATNSTDLRWRRSREAIKRAFIEALHQRDFEHITVSAIVSRAKVSRRTFYLHYRDKFDLLDQLEQHLLEQIRQAFAEDQSRFKQQLPNLTNLRRQNYLLINQALQAINHERRLWQALLSANGDSHFAKTIWDLVTKEINTRIKLCHARFSPKIPQHYAEELVTAGIMGLIQTWLNQRHPESVDHFAQILTDSQLIAPLDLLEKADN